LKEQDMTSEQEPVTAEGAKEQEATENHPDWTRAVESNPHGPKVRAAAFADYAASDFQKMVPDELETTGTHHPSAAAYEATRKH
jgi:hypothetical protein